ncbi:hypothetical protein, partial [Arthrobacter sp. NIO-1057]|uniref:hypothetical protein n=1 Tax=Arthrobacter sp. NIO-1057 TaxID=993071 RepID=UPI001C401161
SFAGLLLWCWGSWCFGVCPVFAAVMSWWIDAGLFVGWCWFGVLLRGCGVVVWELYSEREHLADEMSLMILFLGLLGV